MRKQAVAGLLLLVSCTGGKHVSGSSTPTPSAPPSPTTASPTPSTAPHTNYPWVGLFRGPKEIPWRYDLASESLVRAGKAWPGFYRISPSGRFVALQSSSFEEPRSTLAIAPATNLRAARVILDEQAFIGSLAWSADEESLFYTSKMEINEFADPTVYTIRRVSRSGEARSEITRIRTTGVSLKGTDAGHQVVLAPDRRRRLLRKPQRDRHRDRPARESRQGHSIRSPRADPHRPFGKAVYWVANETQLVRRSFDGVNEKFYSVGPSARRAKAKIFSFAYDAHGRQIALLLQYDQKPRAITYLLSAESGRPTILFDDHRADWVRPLSWLPDGSAVFLETLCSCGYLEERHRTFLLGPDGRRTDLSSRVTRMALEGWLSAGK